MNFRRGGNESIKKHCEPRTIDLDTGLRAVQIELRKRAALQALVEKPESVAIPEQEFDAIATLIGEYEEMTGERIVAEHVAHHLAQAVVGLAKVHRRACHEDTYRIRQAQHDSRSVTRSAKPANGLLAGK